MEVLRFQLSGKNAMFKKPHVNSYYYFTYGMLHKVALMGIFGAVLGYQGYGSVMAAENGNICFGDREKPPEFYQRLKEIQVGIEPLNKKGYIPKKIQVFNNSVGYASREQGGNLIINEQWLENPSWNIYVLLKDKESEKIAEYIMSQKSIYIPYLGKNDHFADILQTEILEAEKISSCVSLESLFLKKHVEFALMEEDEEEEEEYIPVFKYAEALPVELDEENWMYHSELFVFTNAKLKKYDGVVYRVHHKNIAFY